jgi:hypothetical protein
MLGELCRAGGVSWRIKPKKEMRDDMTATPISSGAYFNKESRSDCRMLNCSRSAGYFVYF